ncbi:MAG: MerR family transcriptional regulator [Chloroflexi bacterium]|nr:MerR family transcriptional regulator [Chloroflexota bacterium]
MYTVKQLSDLAGISVRTLHYYDEIALLQPSSVGENGYRYYADDAVLRLQQILFFRELDFSLSAIKDILGAPDFDIVEALHTHREALQHRVKRLNHLIQTVDQTILHLSGEVHMSKKQLFWGFTEEEEQRYTQEARDLYGAEQVDATYKRWNSYSAQKKEQIMVEGQGIYTDLVTLIEHSPSSPEVQQVIARWHQHLRYFYEPPVELMAGLGQHYVDSPDFANKFRQLHPDLPEFLRDAITHYCEGLRASE